ncbi:type II toxin-antitoxin system PemK/MazF family toxin [Arthrobacter sp. I2-34]|uniref:Type II toxin-antitoxin system PemK/MazF family toxin n=1 Tax=Arthrobacter hankyongi TaxID=2904801 RepID=A0ABS9L6W6_9MICC|nr:type II toxin-antitoxin system PemK/MazF family toxin [Arthrobacter hankyongi]MCG2622237.1 type II toxin-antitoxin system PemK/MazF family toxin [Arthrobacter hankyongi]
MAFDSKKLGRLLKGAADMLKAAGAPKAGTPKTRTAGTGTAKTPTATAAGRRTTTPRPAARPEAKPAPQPAERPAARGAAGQLSSPYPGDFRGRAKASYAPKPDGDPDPGEVVWTWVPFEEDYSQGKDRPVLLIGRSGQRLLALMLTSKDRNNGSRRDEDYLDVGTGPWDSKGRPSEVKLDRILQIDPRDIRREGSVMNRTAFAQVAKALQQLHGWS